MNVLSILPLKHLHTYEYTDDLIIKTFTQVKDFEIPIIVVAAFGLMFALVMPCVGCCVYRRKKMIRSQHFHQKRCAIMSCLLFSVVLFML